MESCWYYSVFKAPFRVKSGEVAVVYPEEGSQPETWQAVWFELNTTAGAAQLWGMLAGSRSHVGLNSGMLAGSGFQVGLSRGMLAGSGFRVGLDRGTLAARRFQVGPNRGMLAGCGFQAGLNIVTSGQP